MATRPKYDDRLSQLKEKIENLSQEIYSNGTPKWKDLDTNLRFIIEHIMGLIIFDLCGEADGETRQYDKNGKNGKTLYSGDLIKATKKALTDKRVTNSNLWDDMFDRLSEHNPNSHGTAISGPERERQGHGNVLESLKIISEILTERLPKETEYSTEFISDLSSIGNQFLMFESHLSASEHDPELIAKFENTIKNAVNRPDLPGEADWMYVLILPTGTDKDFSKIFKVIKNTDWRVILDCGKEDGQYFKEYMESVSDHLNNIAITKSLSSTLTNWFFVFGRKPGENKADARNILRKINGDRFSKRNLFVIDASGNISKAVSSLETLWEMCRTDDVRQLYRTTVVVSTKADELSERLKEDSYEDVTCVDPQMNISEFIRIAYCKRELPALDIPDMEQLSKSEINDCSNVGIRFLESDPGDKAKTDIYDDFYSGRQITTSELETDCDVTPRGSRNAYNKFIEDIRHCLTGADCERFEIMQQPGAGGTTVARRIAYDLRESVTNVQVLPVFIHKYVPTKTVDMLTKLAMYPGTRPRRLLVIADDKEISSEYLLTIYSKMNQSGKSMVFVYIKHTHDLTEKSGKNRLSLVSELRSEEDRLFEDKFRKIFSQRMSQSDVNKTIAGIRSTPAGHNIQMIDYPYAFNEKIINRGNSLPQLSYVSEWFKKLESTELKDLCGFTAFVYNFTASRPLNRYTLDKVWRKSGILTLEDGYPSDQRDILDRLLKPTAEHGEKLSTSRYYAPRYSAFAPSILEQWNATWKDSLSDISIRFIELLPDTLDEDEHNLVIDLFIQQSKNDYRGQDKGERFRVELKDRFSVLIGWILKGSDGFQGAKRVFEALIDKYPDDVFYKLHYARLLFENARNNNADIDDRDMNEAGRLIEEALADDMATYADDFYHIKGMYWRRKAEMTIDKSANSPMSSESDLYEYVDTALEAFEQCNNISRGTNPYGYMSAVQLIRMTIEGVRHARGISKNNNSFLDEEPFVRYMEVLNSSLLKLNDSALRSQLPSDEEYLRIKDYYHSLIGNDWESIDNYLKLLETARGDRHLQYGHRLIAVTRYCYEKNNKTHKASYTSMPEERKNEYVAQLRLLADQFKDIQACEELFKIYRYNSAEEFGKSEADTYLNKWESLAREKGDSTSLLRALFYQYVSCAARLIITDEADRALSKRYLDYREECRELIRILPNSRYTPIVYLGNEDIHNWRTLLDPDEAIDRDNNNNVRYIKNRCRIVESLVVGINESQGDCESGMLTKISFSRKGRNIFTSDIGKTKIKGIIGFRLNGPGLYNPDTNMTDNIIVEPTEDRHQQPETTSSVMKPESDVNTITASKETDGKNLQAKNAEPEVFRIETPVVTAPKIIGKIDLDNIKSKSRPSNKGNHK